MLILLLSLLSVPLCAQELPIVIDGQPVTSFHHGNDVGRPYLWPLQSLSGKVITRAYPMEEVAGESRDHPHHRGLWFGYDDVNGTKFWAIDPSFHDPAMGRITVVIDRWRSENRLLTTRMHWLDPKGNLLLTEDRETSFPSDPQSRILDFRITLTAAQDVTFGDTKEGAFAIRLSDEFTTKRGLKMKDSEGRSDPEQIWGKRARWVDYEATVGGEAVGVAIFDHPSNPLAPTHWHARDYGLFSVNPFGSKGFDPGAKESRLQLPKGKSLTFRWLVVIHPADADIEEMYRTWVKSGQGVERRPALR